MGTNSLCCASKRGESCEVARLPRKTGECLGDQIRWGGRRQAVHATNSENHLLLWEGRGQWLGAPCWHCLLSRGEGGSMCLPAHTIHSAPALG